MHMLIRRIPHDDERSDVSCEKRKDLAQLQSLICPSGNPGASGKQLSVRDLLKFHDFESSATVKERRN